MTTSELAKRYPVLDQKDGRDYLERLRNAVADGTDPWSTPSREIADAPVDFAACRAVYDPATVAAMVAELRDLVRRFATESKAKATRNEFDEKSAEIVYRHASDLPHAALFDEDFWRFLSVHELFEVIAWRFPDTASEGWTNNFGVGKSFDRCYPYKSYRRGHLVDRLVDAEFAWTDHDDVDFYDSHLFGRRSGRIPAVASALCTLRAELERSQALRPYAKTATRYRAGHLTELLAPDEIEAKLRKFTKR